tara:strand:+ start:65 stop:781 length:717 start_codon:yes stop_codon:yes gene_type:complete
MRNKIRVLCTICARKGSKGLKNKNVRKLNSIPLITHTILQAKRSKLFNKIVISSDSRKIFKISRKQVDLFINRPESLSGDKVSKIDVIKHALINSEKKLNTKFDIIIDLDATSPLRKISDIRKSLKKFLNSNSSNLISVTKARKNPYFNQIMFKKNKPTLPCALKKKIINRQSAPKVYDLNASIYIWKRKALLTQKKLINQKTSTFIMPNSRSIDIDGLLEFKIVEHILKKKLYNLDD